nr:Toll/interleukin-1 receptor (TIR) domain-containing protein [Tanacetum cinerariifolium]GFA92087.1 Toll/interleukin-1 receptor (TIR) domain-containing protein [Tanacetum cinerariifolium]GFA96550.1 Toll/interleukin-1 receptor (TIR) domain-containing protein [Tanacetum cinerariifolium]
MSFIKEAEYMQIPFQDILLATSSFAQENFIAFGGFGSVYQGQSKQHGYIDPEYLGTAVLTKESDVYSFGVVLFEVLCGRPARVKDECEFLFMLAQTHYEMETLDKIIHSDLKKQINSASLHTFSSIAYQCLRKCRKDRPTMKAVVENLEEALNYQLGLIESWGVAYNRNKEKNISASIIDDLSADINLDGLPTYKDNMTHSNFPVEQS